MVYVDTWGEGELLKETFDIQRVPSIRLVKGDKVFALKWVDGLWKVEELVDFVKNYESSSYDFKRGRITEGLPLYFEYIINTMAEGKGF